jgi:hypothetical protein
MFVLRVELIEILVMKFFYDVIKNVYSRYS